MKSESIISPIASRRWPAGIAATTASAAEDRLIGDFGFAGRDPVEHFVFHLPLKAGDMAPDVELFDIAAGKKVRLGDCGARPCALSSGRVGAAHVSPQWRS